MKTRLLIFLLLLGASLNGQSPFLSQFFQQNAEQLGPWYSNPEPYEVQLIYTQIDRDANNRPTFTSHYWGCDSTRYFYPASTVKMPTAIMALEKLNRLSIRGLNQHTPMRILAATPPQTAAHIDTTTANMLPFVAQYVRKIFLVSDNDAHNRLYEFLGQRYLNEHLGAKGFERSRIIHRLSVSGFDKEANRHTNPIQFFDEKTGQLLYHQGEVYSKWYPKLGLRKELRGKAYMTDEGAIIEEPFDFRYKNYVSLQDLHDILQTVLFPDAVPEKQRFLLSEADYQLIYEAMRQFPRESASPKYDHPDNYVKFWLFGDGEKNIPDHIRIFNKVGWAYGYLTDVAYIIDLEKKVEFMLVGTIHVNANETYNDGEYEYEKIGLPFFEQVGKLIYEHELKRERQYRPDFSRFLK